MKCNIGKSIHINNKNNIKILFSLFYYILFMFHNKVNTYICMLHIFYVTYINIVVYNCDLFVRYLRYIIFLF